MYFFHGLGALQPKARDGAGSPMPFNIILIIGQNGLSLQRLAKLFVSYNVLYCMSALCCTALAPVGK